MKISIVLRHRQLRFSCRTYVAGSREIVSMEVCIGTFKGFSDRPLVFLSISRHWKTEQKDPRETFRK